MELAVINNNTNVEILINNVNSEDVIQMYLKTLKSPHTVRVYDKCIRDFFIYLYGTDNISLSQMVVDPVDASKYAEYCKERLDKGEIKTATYNGKIKGVKQFYDWLITQTTSNKLQLKLFHINPFSVVKQLNENDKEGSEPLTLEEIQLMLDNPYGKSAHIQERNKLLLELGITTGIRNTALLSLTEDDIKKDGTNYYVEVIDKENKTAKRGITPYYDRLITWYERDKIFRGGKDGTIFNLTPIHANRIIKGWAESVGITKKITFHSLRTTTAVMVTHNTGSLSRAQLVLGHTFESTTKGYVDKERTINTDAENLLQDVDKLKEFDDLVSNVDTDNLINALNNLDADTKLKIMKNLIGRS